MRSVENTHSIRKKVLSQSDFGSNCFSLYLCSSRFSNDINLPHVCASLIGCDVYSILQNLKKREENLEKDLANSAEERNRLE